MKITTYKCDKCKEEMEESDGSNLSGVYAQYIEFGIYKHGPFDLCRTCYNNIAAKLDILVRVNFYEEEGLHVNNNS